MVFAGPISENSAPGGWKGQGATKAAAGRPDPPSLPSPRVPLPGCCRSRFPLSHVCFFPALLPASCPPAPPETLMFAGAPSPGPPFFSLSALSLAILPQPQGLILRWSPVTTRYLAEQAKLTVILEPLFPPSSRDSHQALWVLPPLHLSRIIQSRDKATASGP